MLAGVLSWIMGYQFTVIRTRAKRLVDILASVTATRSNVVSILVTTVVAEAFTAQVPLAKVSLNSTT